MSELSAPAPITIPATLSFPVAVPTPARMEEIFREECARAAEQMSRWFRLEEAANHLRIGVTTLKQWRKVWGLPVAQLTDGDDGVQIYSRADLDRIAIERLKFARPHCAKCEAEVVIPFPSVAAYEALRKGEAVNFG